MISVILLFIFSDVMTKLNTDEWQYQFLGITLFTVVLNGTMTAIFQVSCIFFLPLKGLTLFWNGIICGHVNHSQTKYY